MSVHNSATATVGGLGAPAPASGWNQKILSKARMLHKELVKLHDQIDTSFLEVGVRLKEIRDRNLYQPLNHPSFNAYVHSLEFSRSRAYALIGVVEDFYLSSRLDRPQMVSIGWEKLALLRAVKDTVSFAQWALKAQEIGKRQLRLALIQSGFIAAPQPPQEPDQAPPIAAEALPSTKNDSLAESQPAPTVQYMAIKKMTAVKWLSAEELEAAKTSGTYPLIVGVVGAAHSVNGSAQGLPRLRTTEQLPVLDSEDEAAPPIQGA